MLAIKLMVLFDEWQPFDFWDGQGAISKQLPRKNYKK
jgi:hypothetical protein